MSDLMKRELLRHLVRNQGVGEIRAKMLLQNVSDVSLCRERRLPKSRVRTVEAEAVVDTGAVLILLPQEIVETLGLPILEKTVVALANDQKIELERAGGLLLTIAGRQMTADCLVGPAGCEPLLGQIVMESLDLIPDPAKRTLTPRPESPFRPTLKMKELSGDYQVKTSKCAWMR